jgi:hypothetical protein
MKRYNQTDMCTISPDEQHSSKFCRSKEVGFEYMVQIVQHWLAIGDDLRTLLTS